MSKRYQLSLPRSRSLRDNLGVGCKRYFLRRYWRGLTYALRAAAVDIRLLVRSFSSYRKRALRSRRGAFYSTKLYGVYSGGRSIIVSLVLEFEYGLAPSYFELMRHLDMLRG